MLKWMWFFELLSFFGAGSFVACLLLRSHWGTAKFSLRIRVCSWRDAGLAVVLSDGAVVAPAFGLKACLIYDFVPCSRGPA